MKDKTKKLKILFIAIILFAVFGVVRNSEATPSISEVPENIANGENVMISGSEFGNNSLNHEWTGDNIENGTNGSIFNKAGWSDTAFPERPRYDNSRSYSGSQSIIFDSTTTNDGRFKLTYDWGSSSPFFYVTWMAYIDLGGANGQWKMYRLNHENDVVDTGPEIVMFNWFGSSDQFIVRRNVSETEQRLYPSGYPSDGSWYRMELYAKPSSSPGENDSSVQLWSHNPDSAINKIVDQTSYISYNSDETKEWRYHVFQNYQGNGLGGYSKVWMDDIYISNTKARIEIGNNQTWESCTHREIQIPTVWADGEINFTVNQGSFLDDDENLHLFVIDENGTASAGYPISFDSGVSDTTPPSAPQGLSVQ